MRLITYPALYSRFPISNYHPVQCVSAVRNYRRGLNLSLGFVHLCVKTTSWKSEVFSPTHSEIRVTTFDVFNYKVSVFFLEEITPFDVKSVLD